MFRAQIDWFLINLLRFLLQITVVILLHLKFSQSDIIITFDILSWQNLGSRSVLLIRLKRRRKRFMSMLILKDLEKDTIDRKLTNIVPVMTYHTIYLSYIILIFRAKKILTLKLLQLVWYANSTKSMSTVWNHQGYTIKLIVICSTQRTC